jgi:hypothetical protein
MRFLNFLLVLCFGVCLSSSLDEEVYNVRAYRSKGKFPKPDDFPETKNIELMKRKNVGIAFTGGGSRSYLASAGQMAALLELDLIKNIRYISGISGGAWFTMMYTFNQNGASDSELLGPIVNPEDITRKGLKKMNEKCMRRATKGTFLPEIFEKALSEKITFGEAWIDAVQDTYCNNLNIKTNQPVAWSQENVDDIKSRNPQLANQDFTLPTNSQRPFPVVGSTMIGPAVGGPYYKSNRNFTMMEMTPLYMGSMFSEEIEYKYAHDDTNHPVTVGGVVEPFGMSRTSTKPPINGLSSGATEGVISVPKFSPSSVWDVAHMAGSSGYAPGAFFDTLPQKILEDTSLHASYWSAADKNPTSRDTLFADGGCYENILVTSMLQRRVEKLVLFFNVHTPLQPASSWDVKNDPPSKTQIARDVGAFFGVEPEDYREWQKRGFDISHNQVWPSDQWPVLVHAMQAAQTKGNGIIATMNLTTIENERWGIDSGIETEVVFVYLGRAFNWEAKLSNEMKELFVPSDPVDALDPSKTISKGPFRSFPHYATICNFEDTERANALADLTGWTIRNNEELFKRILS